MKKTKRILYILIILMILTLTGCNTQISNTANLNNLNLGEKINTSEELKEKVKNDIDDTITKLNNDFESLKKEINTYGKYSKNKDKIQKFYINISNTQNQLNIRLREYSLSYTQSIVNSNLSSDEKYEKLEDLYDIIYEDAADDIYEKIDNGVLKNMFDTYYDGILEDAYDKVSYEKWYHITSKEYDMWSDTSSDIYDNWSDLKSYIDKLYTDISDEIWEEDMERANEKLQNFKEDIDTLKNEK